MKSRFANKLFKYKKPYDLIETDKLFIKAMRENAIYQYEKNLKYKKILDDKKFNPYLIKSFDDLINLPFITTQFLKRNELFTMSKKRMLIKATSSGTSGKKSIVGMNFKALYRGLRMVLKLFRFHKLFSLRRVRYIIFGYEPHKSNKLGIAKTANGFTYLAPARKKTFAIRWTKEGYKIDLDNIKKEFIKAANKNQPVRSLGFPYYTYHLLKEMKEEGIKLKLHKKSLITTGGGWKQFFNEKIDKVEFQKLVEEVLGVPRKNCIDFFGAVEHPILYIDCEYNRFHIPVYSRVIVRDVDTLEPVKNGEIGLLNLLTPMIDSMPLLSIMTDDLCVLHDNECPCGCKSPWIEIIGRVGIKDIVTCAQGAEEFLKSGEKK